MESNPKEFVWVERYRPRHIDDCILPVDLKAIFKKFVEQKNIPNMLLTGRAGVGKTTVAKAMLEELECDYIVKNGSLNTDKDSLRNEIATFASSISFAGGRKYVILDEADNLSAAHVQPALRNFMEEYSRNCGFILTANYPNKLIEPLLSRCPPIEFTIKPEEKPVLAMEFLKRAEEILTTEGVQYDRKALSGFIIKWFPDWRRIINELQKYAARGAIDSGILKNFEEISIDELLGFMKSKNYTEVRKWVGENADMGETAVYRRFYDAASQVFDPRYIPQLVVTLGRYQYQAAFSVDPEINLSACLAEIMVDVGDMWKK